MAPGTGCALLLPDSGAQVSYDALRSQVMEMAAALQSAGVGPGERVAMALPNGAATIVSFLAASIAGTAAPLNPAYRYEEFLFYLEDTNARVIILPPDGAGEARRAAQDRNVQVLVAETDAAGNVRLAGSAGAAGSARRPQADDIALVLHTSGSTGRPKRVPLRHRNLAVSVKNIARTYELAPADRSLCVMPLFHVHGLMASTMATLYTGGTVVVPSKFNPLSFARVVRDHGVTWYSAVPTIHQLVLARRGGQEGFPSLRFVRSCSASLAP